MKVTRAMSVTFQPSAECLTDGCGHVWLSKRSTRDEVKSHVSSTGHEVRVVSETVDIYRPAQA